MIPWEWVWISYCFDLINREHMRVVKHMFEQTATEAQWKAEADEWHEARENAKSGSS